MHSRRSIAVAAAFALSVGFASGCSDDDSNGTDDVDSTTSLMAPAAPSNGEMNGDGTTNTTSNSSSGGVSTPGNGDGGAGTDANSGTDDGATDD